MPSQRHHGLFPRVLHDADKTTKQLRRSEWMIPRLDGDAHKALHKEVSIVPVPTHYMVGRIANGFHQVRGNYVETFENYARAVEDAMAHPKCTYIERELGGLIVYAITQQIPFINEGLIDGVL